MKDFIMNDYKLYKRKNKYYIDFIHPETGKRIRESLKTSDEKLAQKYANTRYFNVLRDIELGISVEDKDLSKIFKEYVDTKPTQYNQDTVQRHWLPYLEEKKIKLSKLKQVDITRYYPWRRARKYQNKDVKDITLNRENCALRSFTNFAMANGYLCPKKDLRFQQFEVVSNRRDEFSQEEAEELIRNAKIRYENAKHSIQKEQRRVLLDYIHFLQITGIRCGTARKLTWKNMFLDEEKPYYSIEAVQNKVKKRLNVPISRDFANWLKEIKSKHQQFCDQNGIKFTSNIHLFSCLYIYKSHKEGRPAAEIISIANCKTAWENLLKSCSFYDPETCCNNKVLYSFRHKKITDLVKKSIDSTQIAKYAQTSVRMINKHYDQSEMLDFYDELAS